jgi:hypothetical protein
MNPTNDDSRRSESKRRSGKDSPSQLMLDVRDGLSAAALILKGISPTFSPMQVSSEDKLILLSKIGMITNVIVQETLMGDSDFGKFLGELIPFLARKQKELAKNKAFSQRLSQIKSTQKARKSHYERKQQEQPNSLHRRDNRSLRSEIDYIIKDARCQQLILAMVKADRKYQMLLGKEISGVSDEVLSELPKFDSSSAVEWFDKVVYPAVQARKAALADNPQIGSLRKAYKSGKFQVSDLKGQIRETVVRIASSPEIYYFGYA